MITKTIKIDIDTDEQEIADYIIAAFCNIKNIGMNVNNIELRNFRIDNQNSD